MIMHPSNQWQENKFPMVNQKDPINTHTHTKKKKKKGEEDGSALFVMLMTTWMSLDESEPCIILRLMYMG